MIKADAYGHGMVKTAKCLEEICGYFGVARLSEALQLREEGISRNILVCAEYNGKNAVDAAENNITLTVTNLNELKAYCSAIKKTKKTLFVHIKTDSGMNRLGVKSLAELDIMLDYLNQCSNIKLSGIYTHFADCTDIDFTNEQYSRFLKYVFRAKREFKDITAHCASSAAIFSSSGYYLDMVRPGINLYGYCTGKALKAGVKLKPAMQVYSTVIAVKQAKQGESIGYCRNYTVNEDLYYAVISAGYGDGIKRSLSNRWSVYINGIKCDIAGNICMDTFMAVLPQNAGQKIKPGDKAVILSDKNIYNNGDNNISFSACAQAAGTIEYEIITSFTSRAQRIYI